MVPFWVYTLGQTIPADEAVGRIKIPFLSILRSLAFLIIPILIGVLIRHKLPKVSRFIKKGLKVFNSKQGPPFTGM
jgi:ACR3 family arsenite efflux pump ArsB